ncbi:hypothetical protein EO98_12880 [Methanosarcina sp. 2.H.T.1A.6]|nr:hypothetical protein EO94_11535 [Methanosarcina sp. 2.H.T.1A.3]KKG18337.1 hypothetical protein EO97_15245 [Methanosarcina sp. 2.H.T.1A.15]KKG23148.1 hypothetical protein EO98_12880 [Methanosarcina sp. 2.H.T.1A.6]KKG26371.1 hypothetical protein EO96_05370 [Methanosarcina sp. 2.H.T.1A.8]
MEEKGLNKTQLILMKYLRCSCANPDKKTYFWGTVAGLREKGYWIIENSHWTIRKYQWTV